MMAKILVAEDNYPHQILLKYRLQKLGYRAVTCDDGLEAIELLENESFDLVILDLGMPRMDGFAVLKHIRATERLRTLPVFILTASASDDHHMDAISSGANKYLQKPISSTKLNNAIKLILG